MAGRSHAGTRRRFPGPFPGARFLLAHWQEAGRRASRYFDCTGRIHRTSYLLRLVTGTLLFVALSWATLGLTGQLRPERNTTGTQLAMLQLALMTIVYLWFLASTFLKRLHDVEMPRRLAALLLALPPLGAVYLAAAPGSFSHNVHGPVPGE